MIRTAFFSTSDNTLQILNKLDKCTNLAFCVTKKDTLVGRKQITKQTSVKKWCIKNKKPYVEIDSLRGENLAEVAGTLIKHGVKLVLVTDFAYIIPKELIGTQDYELINIHFSLLPKYRGASPIQHTILNGDEFTGITFQYVHSEMDKGDILYQVRHKLKGNETSQELREALFELTEKHLCTFITGLLNNELHATKQDDSIASYCYSPTHPKSTYIFKEDAKIGENDTLETIDRKLRAYYPWPIVWISVAELEKAFNIYKDGLRKKNALETEGLYKDQRLFFKQSIVHNDKIKLYSAKINEQTQTLEIENIQMEGKKIVSWKDFVNGYLC